ncbi:unnamed protein product [marine sediment metagenome]|uniref:Uncharacterized protein n=1 Tax=marine sediment metagenome TaxID=412755 RepID=X1FV25_9ZZZZ
MAKMKIAIPMSKISSSILNTTFWMIIILKLAITTIILQMEKKIPELEDSTIVLWSLNNKLELNIENYVDDISTTQEFQI